MADEENVVDHVEAEEVSVGEKINLSVNDEGEGEEIKEIEEGTEYEEDEEDEEDEEGRGQVQNIKKQFETKKVDSPRCEPEKPICFNYTKDENKNILYNCDDSSYNIFEALEAAYAIKNNENDNKYDNYKLKQCMNKANDDFNDQNTCTCTNFDSVWMTAIKQAERQSKIIQNELAKPETAVIIKENIDKPPTETEIIKKKK